MKDRNPYDLTKVKEDRCDPRLQYLLNLINLYFKNNIHIFFFSGREGTEQWYLYKMNISDINAPYLEKTIFFKYILYTTINNIEFRSDILNGVVITDSSSYSSIISSYITDIHHDLMLDYDASFVILSTECDTKY